MVFLNDEWSIAIASIIVQTPNEYGGMGGVIGLQYSALKDFARWAVPEEHDEDDVLKQLIPLLISLGNYYASEVNRNSK